MLKNLILTFFLFWLVFMLGGCTATLKNHGEVGARWGAEFTFFSRASATADEEATAKLEVPALTELVVGEPDPEP